MAERKDYEDTLESGPVLYAQNVTTVSIDNPDANLFGIPPSSSNPNLLITPSASSRSSRRSSRPPSERLQSQQPRRPSRPPPSTNFILRVVDGPAFHKGLSRNFPYFTIAVSITVWLTYILGIVYSSEYTLLDISASSPISPPNTQWWFYTITPYPFCDCVTTQAWRIFSMQCVHEGYYHIAGNTLGLLIYGIPLEMYHPYGTIVTLVITECSLIWGVLGFSFLFPYEAVVGISPGVYGMIGATIILVLVQYHRIDPVIYLLVLVELIAGILMGIGTYYIQYDSNTAYPSHAFSMVAGFLMGACFMALDDGRNPRSYSKHPKQLQPGNTVAEQPNTTRRSRRDGSSRRGRRSDRRLDSLQELGDGRGPPASAPPPIAPSYRPPPPVALTVVEASSSSPTAATHSPILRSGLRGQQQQQGLFSDLFIDEEEGEDDENDDDEAAVATGTGAGVTNTSAALSNMTNSTTSKPLIIVVSSPGELYWKNLRLFLSIISIILVTIISVYLIFHYLAYTHPPQPFHGYGIKNDNEFENCCTQLFQLEDEYPSLTRSQIVQKYPCVYDDNL